MKIGAELRLGGDVGELFADARALEAAGADSLWVLTRDDQDPCILAAALAATTWRARLVAAGAGMLPSATPGASHSRSSALDRFAPGSASREGPRARPPEPRNAGLYKKPTTFAPRMVVTKNRSMSRHRTSPLPHGSPVARKPRGSSTRRWRVPLMKASPRTRKKAAHHP